MIMQPIEKQQTSVGIDVSYTGTLHGAERPKKEECVLTGVGNANGVFLRKKTIQNNLLGGSVGNVGNAKFLQILRPAPLRAKGVGNVGNTYRFPTFLHPRCAAVLDGAKS